jgi:hypothetical protein
MTLLADVMVSPSWLISPCPKLLAAEATPPATPVVIPVMESVAFLSSEAMPWKADLTLSWSLLAALGSTLPFSWSIPESNEKLVMC